jgi:DNA polymerase
MKIVEEGSPAAPVWLVGEAPGEVEVSTGRPFTGPSGALLDGALREAGLAREACYLTNVCHERPPTYRNKAGKEIQNDIDQWFLGKREAAATGALEVNGRYPAEPIRRGLDRLNRQLAEHRPRVVILLGNTPLWAVAAQQGITKWRGSVFPCGTGAAVAAFHPADCLPNRSPQHRILLVHDLQRAKRILASPALAVPTDWDFAVPRSVIEMREWLGDCGFLHRRETPTACDIETWRGQIHCIGFATSERAAMCIPFMRVDLANPHWWSADDECEIVRILQDVLVHYPMTFHNGLYDVQYIARQWGIMPWHADDTMAMQHVAFPGLLGGKIDPVTGRVDKRGSSLSLSFIASLYCRYYKFWKMDGRNWVPGENSEEDYFRYNMEDCCRTWECRHVLQALLKREALWDQYRLIMRTFEPAYKMMFEGFAVDQERMQAMYDGCGTAMVEDRAWLSEVCGVDDINPESAPQMQHLFYTALGQEHVYKGRGADRKLTCDDSALDKIARRTPLLAPLCERIQHYRSMETVRKDCDRRMLEEDGRLYAAWNPAYVETFRGSSNETAFGRGTNLQNFKRPEK